MALTICFYLVNLVPSKNQAQLFRKERANFITLFGPVTIVNDKLKPDMILLRCSTRDGCEAAIDE